MAEDEILRRLDQHMVRGNEVMARSNEVMADVGQALAEHHQAMEDIRFELTQMSMRGERVAREFIAELQEHRGVLRDLVAESRAQRAALFAMLEHMRGGGRAAAGA